MDPNDRGKLDAPGIYVIVNTVTGKRYVGSASNISKRWHIHRKTLRAGTHTNRHLQAAWAQSGESAFRFLVLENTSDLTAREQHWLDEHDAVATGYNIAPTARSSRGVRRTRPRPPASAETRAKISATKRAAGIRTRGASKLTMDQARELRARYGNTSRARGPKSAPSLRAIGLEYGISPGQVCSLLKGQTYREEVP